MKNKMLKAGVCLLAAGMLFTNAAYGTQMDINYDEVADVTAFWKKKDKEAMPNPQPTAEPSVNPTAPREVPRQVPQEGTPQETSDGSLV